MRLVSSLIVESATAQLYFNSNLVATQATPIVSDVVNGLRFLFTFPKPSEIGLYQIAITIISYGGNCATKIAWISYVDDDPLGPVNEYSPVSIFDSDNSNLQGLQLLA